jgi:hypothetical protein
VHHQEEHLNSQHCPLHLFEDMLWFLPLPLQKECGCHGRKQTQSNQALRSLIMSCTLNAKAWCVKHGRLCSRPSTTDLHLAGSPCTDASALGPRTFMSGRMALVFWTWCRLVESSAFKVVIHENVVQFGIKALERALGHMYVILRLLVDPRDLGWPARRPRQLCVLVLKSFVQAPLQSQLERRMQELFFRRCQFHYSAFRVATDEEVSDMLQALRIRKEVVQHRFRGGDDDINIDVDRRFGFLTLCELDRVDRYSRFAWLLDLLD